MDAFGPWLFKGYRLCYPEINSDLEIGVRVLISEHAYFEKFRPLNLQRVRRTENSYSDLKVANIKSIASTQNLLSYPLVRDLSNG